MRFAGQRAGGVALAPRPDGEGATVVLSHVLNELAPAELRRLVASLAGAAEILWVEAGSHEELSERAGGLYANLLRLQFELT